ncbi:MAG: hypothetical protein ABR564_03910 [Candidatus Dormibacteria bacterium]
MERFVTGVTYWPAEVGPYLWHEFPAPQVRADLAEIAARGFDTVRVLLAWDAFMPSDREVHPQRLAELGMLLEVAAEHSLRVVPVLFAQSIGDCVMLPGYTVDPGASRPGVRVLSDGRAGRGGPRDLYTDPLMIELAGRWLEALLASFAHHPALAAWDLGHDPAATVRPRRFGDMPFWVRLMADQIHAAGDACWLTLGADDLLTARGVRLRTVVSHVDALGIAVFPQVLGLASDPLDVEAVHFLNDLARAFAGENVGAIVVSTGVAASTTESELAADRPEARPGLRPRPVRASPLDPPPVEPIVAGRHAMELLDRLPAAGAAGALAWSWLGAGPRLAGGPPFDRFPFLGRCGLVDAEGRMTPAGEAWQALAAREVEVARAPSWNPPVGEEDYYAHLPESARDVFSSWRGAR